METIIHYSGLGLCIIAILMLIAAYSKKRTRAYKARRAEKKGL